MNRKQNKSIHYVKEAVDTVQWEHNVQHKDPTPTQHFLRVCVSDFDVFSQLLPGPKKSISHFSAQWQIWMRAEVKQLQSLAATGFFFSGNKR